MPQELPTRPETSYPRPNPATRLRPDKTASLNDGRSPIVEKGLDELIRDNVANGRLRATTSTKEAVAATDLSLICVGTPSRRNGSLDLTYLERVCEQIGALRCEASVEPVGRLADLRVGVGPGLDAAERALALRVLGGRRKRLVVVVPAVALDRQEPGARRVRPPLVTPPAAPGQADLLIDLYGPGLD